jgi:hypothetical protein
MRAVADDPTIPSFPTYLAHPRVSHFLPTCLLTYLPIYLLMLFHTYQLSSFTPFKCDRWQNWQFQLVASLSLSTYSLSILSFPTYLLTYLPIYLPTCCTLLLLLIYLQSFMANSCHKWQNCQFKGGGWFRHFLPLVFVPVGCLKLQNWHYSIIFLPTYGELYCYFLPTSGLLHPRTCS